MGRRRLPSFVFVFDGRQHRYLYDVLHQRWVQVTDNTSFQWLRTTFSIQALYMDWLILLHLDGFLSVFHPPTGQQLLLPTLDHGQTSIPGPINFIYRFSADPPDCHVVAFHKTDHYFRVCRPGVDARWSPMHELHIPRVGDLDRPQLKPDRYIQDVVLCNGKLYALTNTCIVVVDGIGGAWHRPKATYMIYEHVLPIFNLNYLVESEGELYLAWKSEKQPNVFGLHRWRFHSESWIAVTSIGNKVFMLGTRYSTSLPANAATGLVAGMVYFLLEDYGICSFNVQCWSLTTHYPRRDFEYNYGDWVLLDEQVPDNVEQSGALIDSRVSVEEVKACDEYPKYLRAMPCNIRNRVGRRGTDMITWSPTTPWLMFAATGHDGRFKFMDPCSNSTVYELDFPELQGKELCHASDGWLVVVGIGSNYLLNPFTGQRIGPFGNRKMSVPSQFALSSSPTSEGCLIFSICPLGKNDGSISVFAVSSGKSTESLYLSYPRTGWPLSNPVYYKGLFYCVGSNGNLGTYDPSADKWSVKDMRALFHPSIKVSNCFLIKSDEDELISVFVDIKNNPIGVYRLDFVCFRWREVSNIGDRTLFIGSKGSFMATSGREEMRNKIYLSKFVQDEYGSGAASTSEISCHQIGDGIVSSTFKERYMSLWIEPRGVKFGYDRATGKKVPPVRFLYNSSSILMSKKRSRSIFDPLTACSSISK